MASRSKNLVILIGNLSRDAETKFTPGGAAVTRFSVATNRRWKDQQTNEWKEEVNYTNVVMWRSENLANYLTKGKQVYVEGRLQTRSYDDKDTGKKIYVTEVVAEDVILTGGGGSGENGHSERPQAAAVAGRTQATGQRPAPAANRPPQDDTYGQGIDESDVPF